VNFVTGYDRWHEALAEADPGHADETAPWYQLVLEYLGDIRGRKVLEVACGRGCFSRVLAGRGARVCGADFSGAALRIASRKSPLTESRDVPARFAQADAQRLPFADESFDIVVSCETVEHLRDPQAALAEMARVCRSGGLLYLTTPNYANAMGLYYLYARGRGKIATPGGDQPYDRVFLFPQIRNMVRRAGWKIVRTDGTVHQFPIWPGHPPIRWHGVEKYPMVRRRLGFCALHQFIFACKRND
jgi:ubiquinone/menaquinone biosynthesis C-methylase UbiE